MYHFLPNQQAPWYRSHCFLLQAKLQLLQNSINISFYIINSKQGKESLFLRNNTYNHTRTHALVPFLIPPIAAIFFMEYSNSTKVIFYFDPKTLRFRRPFYYYIDEYDIQLHP